MTDWANVYKSISVVFASLPGLAILIANIGVPPDESTLLFGGIVEVVGIILLLLLFINSHKIEDYSVKRTNIIAVASLFGFIFFLAIYIYLFRFLVIKHPDYEPVYFPLWSSGDLTFMLTSSGGKMNSIEKYGRDAVIKCISSTSQNNLILTTIILLFIYNLIFAPIIIGFGILGLRAKKMLLS